MREAISQKDVGIHRRKALWLAFTHDYRIRRWHEDEPQIATTWWEFHPFAFFWTLDKTGYGAEHAWVWFEIELKILGFQVALVWESHPLGEQFVELAEDSPPTKLLQIWPRIGWLRKLGQRVVTDEELAEAMMGEHESWEAASAEALELVEAEIEATEAAIEEAEVVEESMDPVENPEIGEWSSSPGPQGYEKDQEE